MSAHGDWDYDQKIADSRTLTLPPTSGDQGLTGFHIYKAWVRLGFIAEDTVT